MRNKPAALAIVFAIAAFPALAQTGGGTSGAGSTGGAGRATPSAGSRTPAHRQPTAADVPADDSVSGAAKTPAAPRGKTARRHVNEDMSVPDICIGCGGR